MQRAGLTSLYPLETLSVMGLVEVLRHLPKLFRVRRHIYKDALEWGADVMIGIDAPDFNLGLERRLRRTGMKTMHYVSPSVWAWRQGRVKSIAKSVDMILAFLPFEAEFYHRHQVPVTYVGHPLADKLPLTPDVTAARQKLGLEQDRPVLALLPGSRHGEVQQLLPDFLIAARLLRTPFPDLQVVLPAATADRRNEIELWLAEFQDLNVCLLDGESDLAMTAADVVLLASGTATLEAMLLKKPMVVAYRLAMLTYVIARRLMKAPFFSLPNILAGKKLVPELLQKQVTPMTLAQEVAKFLNDDDERNRLESIFMEQHERLRCDASRQAASAVYKLIGNP
jgi:lipid-A-disaccharide synthase